MAEREPGPEQARELLAQLAAAREAFRKEVAGQAAGNAKLDRRKKQIARLHTAARAEKLRIRKLYQRFLQHMKRKWSGERISVENERRELIRERADLDRKAAESQEYQQRLYASWEQLHEGQRRLLAERQQAETWLAQQTDTLDHRSQTVAQHERQFAASREELEAKLHGLQQEIAGLDARAANARTTIEQLELRQSRLLVPADGYSEPMSVSLVSLDSSSNAPAGSDADGLLVDLHSRQQDLDRVRRKIFAARDELQRQTTSLDDQRAILSEQVATLVAARELWNSAELATLGEMETLAKALRGKERGMELREQQLIEAERLSRERESELWALREQLEAWRRALAAHESANLAARDQHWAALTSERQRLKWREESLAEIAQTWSEIREREREHYVGVIEHLEAERSEYSTALNDAERDRQHYAEEITRYASLQLALQEAVAEKDDLSERKLRILSARWEKHFKRWDKQLETKRSNLERAATQAHELRHGLHMAMTRWLEERSPAIEAKQKQDLERFALETAEIAESPSSSLPERTEREMERLRSEIDRLSAILGGEREAPEQVALSG